MKVINKSNSKNKISFFLIVLFYVALLILFYFWDAPLKYLEDLTKTGSLFAPLILIVVSFLEVIVAPISILPLLPPLSIIFGPFLAATYVLIGWILGSVVAFYIARIYGRPILGKFISLKSIEKYENYIPEQMEFWWAFLLRFIFQVDALSYAFGLFSRISFWKYFMATLFSFIPIVYSISYAGEAFLMKNFSLFIIFSLAFIILFIVLSYFYYKEGGAREEIEEEHEKEQKEETYNHS
jgi:uncharacterized membrane protein YdjX (TVP38/TMEM64 family)